MCFCDMTHTHTKILLPKVYFKASTVTSCLLKHRPSMNLQGLLFPHVNQNIPYFIFFYFLQPFCPHSISHVAAAFSNGPSWSTCQVAEVRITELVVAGEEDGGGGGGVLPDDFIQSGLSGARARRLLGRSAAQCRCSERLMELTAKPQPMAWVCARACVCVDGGITKQIELNQKRERETGREGGEQGGCGGSKDSECVPAWWCVSALIRDEPPLSHLSPQPGTYFCQETMSPLAFTHTHTHARMHAHTHRAEKNSTVATESFRQHRVKGTQMDPFRCSLSDIPADTLHTAALLLMLIKDMWPNNTQHTKQ